MPRKGVLASKGLLALVVAAFAIVPAGKADARISRDFWGVTYGFHLTLPQADVDKMAAGHVGAVRWTLAWPRIEPREGEFHWDRADAVIGALASKGIPTQPTLMSTPYWALQTPVAAVEPIPSANTGQLSSTPPLSPRASAAWTQFLRLAVERYGPGGTYWDPACAETATATCYHARYGADAAPRPIREWQIWNEPSLGTAFVPEPSARKYAELVRISHDAISAADPTADIALAGVPGNVSYKGWNYLDDLYRVRGIKSSFDLVAVHPYGATTRSVETQMKRFRRVMKRHGDRRTGVWVSEIGWGSGRRDGNLNVGLSGQKRMLSQGFRLLRAERRHWNVERVSWFDWRDPEAYQGGCGWCPLAGLFDSAGAPKPAWRAFKSAAGR